MAGENPHRSEVTVELEGQPHLLKLDLDAIARVEQITERSFQELWTASVNAKLRVVDMAAVIWASLRSAGDERDFQELQKQLYNNGLMKVAGPVQNLILAQAAGISEFEEDDDEEEPPGEPDGASSSS